MSTTRTPRSEGIEISQRGESERTSEKMDHPDRREQTHKTVLPREQQADNLEKNIDQAPLHVIESMPAAAPVMKRVPPVRQQKSDSSALRNQTGPKSGARMEPGVFDPTVWQKILASVRKQQPSLVREWFNELVPRHLTNGVIQVLVPKIAQLHFCQGQCQQVFTVAAQEVIGSLVVVSFHCENIPAGGVFNDLDQPVPLNPDNVFENFVTGPCNRLAHAASVAVSEKPGTGGYNPLFIHGDVGLGKTHLLQAVCQNVLEAHGDKRILYLSCDSFINQFMNAVQNGDMNNFLYRYRNVDMLVIDDIHFLAGRDRTQEEFFHTFNTLHLCNKQIILSADCPPGEIPELEDRLVSRFKMGLVARVEKPCYETRIAIIQKKARLRALSLPEEVIHYIAGKIESNTRELEGAITKLQGVAILLNGVINLDLAKSTFGDTATPEKKFITLQMITDVVSKYYGVRLPDLQGKKRHKSIAFPRQVCMYLARKFTRYSLQDVGLFFGGRDHTTVLHAVATIKADRENDPEVAEQLVHLENQIA